MYWYAIDSPCLHGLVIIICYRNNIHGIYCDEYVSVNLLFTVVVAAQGELIISTREGHRISDEKYFATAGLLEFTCNSSQGINTSWHYKSLTGVENVSENSTGMIYQVTKQTGQVLYVNWTESTNQITFICKSASENATLIVDQGTVILAMSSRKFVFSQNIFI